MAEVWRQIEGYEGIYEVSNTGKVKSLNRTAEDKIGRTYLVKGRILKGGISRNHRWVYLCENGEQKGAYVARLVAKAFIPNLKNKPEVNHKNGKESLNNHVANLEWATSSENQKHAYRTGLKKPTYYRGNLTEKDVKKIRNIKYKDSNITLRELSDVFNTTLATISRVLNNKIWKHVN